MSTGYAYRHSLPHVSRDTFDPLYSARQEAPAPSHDQIIWNENKRHADHWDTYIRQDDSPISALSPPHSSTSLEFPSYFGSQSHHDSNMCRYESSICSHDVGSEQITPPSSVSKFSGIPNLMLATSYSQCSSESSYMSTNNTTDLHRKVMMYPLPDDCLDANVAESSNQNAGTLGDDLHYTLYSGANVAQNPEEVVEKRDGCIDTLKHPSNLMLNKGTRVQHLLVHCAKAIAEERSDIAKLALQELKKNVSVYGDPFERLGVYMSEALVARLRASGSAIYETINCRQTPVADVCSASQTLYEICPYIKFAYMAANGAIAEAFKGESMVHIFDFHIGEGMQWLSLIQALAIRPGGAPHVRITTIDDSTALGDIDYVRRRLTKLASSLGVPFEFTTILTKVSNLGAHMIERRPGEALALNFALQLHHMPDESVCLDNPRDRLLRLAKNLNPKLLTLVEQDANTNTAPFLARFKEILDYYSSVFESIDVALPRESRDRVKVEEHCLAREIVNVVACEGVQRVERFELAGKWRSRMQMAGFKPRPLSVYVNNTIKCLLESYHELYKLKEDGLVLLLGWRERSLVAASAWH